MTGENTIEYSYTEIMLYWDLEQFNPYVSYISFAAIVGIIIMAVCVGRALKLADALLGFIATVFSMCSRLIYVRI